MATDKNKSENLSVESRLNSLYKLQTVLTEIDRIKTIRGELPLEVKDLEDNLEGLRTRIANFNADIDTLRQKLAQEKEKIADSQNKIARYKEQLDNVRNNREFDLLSKEVEFQPTNIETSMPPSGRNMLLVTESKMSKIVIPDTVNDDNGPNERAQKIPKNVTKPIVAARAFGRLICHRSTQKATPTSVSDIVDVRDAMSSNRKKRVDHTAPPAIWLNMSGNTSKIS